MKIGSTVMYRTERPAMGKICPNYSPEVNWKADKAGVVGTVVHCQIDNDGDTFVTIKLIGLSEQTDVHYSVWADNLEEVILH